MSRVLDGYTKRGHEWLQLLSQGPADASSFGNAACRCRRNGWCEWLRGKNGLPPPEERRWLEILTETGRAKLAEWNAQKGEAA